METSTDLIQKKRTISFLLLVLS